MKKLKVKDIQYIDLGHTMKIWGRIQMLVIGS